MEVAHDFSFRNVAQYIDENVIKGQKNCHTVFALSVYIALLDETRLSNPNFRADKLKHKLEKHPILGTKLAFTKVQPNTSSWPFYLVYSSSMSVDEAVIQAYQLASTDAIKDVALLLRVVIQRA